MGNTQHNDHKNDVGDDAVGRSTARMQKRVIAGDVSLTAARTSTLHFTTTTTWMSLGSVPEHSEKVSDFYVISVFVCESVFLTLSAYI